MKNGSENAMRYDCFSVIGRNTLCPSSAHLLLKVSPVELLHEMTVQKVLFATYGAFHAPTLITLKKSDEHI